MRGRTEKKYTIDNNVRGTHNVLLCLVEADLDCHVVHLGTTGVYGYGGAGFEIPEGYLPVTITGSDGSVHEREILFPTKPGSIYHTTKNPSIKSFSSTTQRMILCGLLIFIKGLSGALKRTRHASTLR